MHGTDPGDVPPEDDWNEPIIPRILIPGQRRPSEPGSQQPIIPPQPGPEES